MISRFPIYSRPLYVINKLVVRLIVKIEIRNGEDTEDLDYWKNLAESYDLEVLEITKEENSIRLVISDSLPTRKVEYCLLRAAMAAAQKLDCEVAFIVEEEGCVKSFVGDDPKPWRDFLKSTAES